MLCKTTLAGCRISDTCVDPKGKLHISSYYSEAKPTKWGISVVDYGKLRTANTDCESDKPISKGGVKVYKLAHDFILVSVSYEENNSMSMNLLLFKVTPELQIEKVEGKEMKSLKFTSVLPSPNGKNFLLIAEDRESLIRKERAELRKD